MIPDPTPFHHWLKDNANLLQPPVNNFCLHAGKDFILMVVGGPNARNDFHVNETEVSNLELETPFLTSLVLNLLGQGDDAAARDRERPIPEH